MPGSITADIELSGLDGRGIHIGVAPVIYNDSTAYDNNNKFRYYVPTVSGIEATQYWMDCVTSRHCMSGLTWKKYCSEHTGTNYTPKITKDFELAGYPINAYNFWREFKSNIEEIGSNLGYNWTVNTWKNHAGQPIWSGINYLPEYSYQQSGLTPHPSSILRYGPPTREEYNKYIATPYSSSIVFFKHHFLQEGRLVYYTGELGNYLSSQSVTTNTFTGSPGVVSVDPEVFQGATGDNPTDYEGGLTNGPHFYYAFGISGYSFVDQETTIYRASGTYDGKNSVEYTTFNTDTIPPEVEVLQTASTYNDGGQINGLINHGGSYFATQNSFLGDPEFTTRDDGIFRNVGNGFGVPTSGIIIRNKFQHHMVGYYNSRVFVYPLSNGGSNFAFRRTNGSIVVPNLYYSIDRGLSGGSITNGGHGNQLAEYVGGQITDQNYEEDDFFFNSDNWELRYKFVDNSTELHNAWLNHTTEPLGEIPGPTSISMNSSGFNAILNEWGASSWRIHGTQSGIIPVSGDIFGCTNYNKKYLAIYIHNTCMNSGDIQKFGRFPIDIPNYITRRVRYSGIAVHDYTTGQPIVPPSSFVTPWTSLFYTKIFPGPPNYDQDKLQIPHQVRHSLRLSGLYDPFPHSIKLGGFRLENRGPKLLYSGTNPDYQGIS